MFATRFATYLRYCENSLTYFHPVFPIIYSKQAYINFNVPKVSDITWNISIESSSPSPPTTFSTNIFQMQHNWRERGEREKKKKTWRGSRRVFYSRFKLCDGHYGNNRSHISPPINSSYGISRVFTRIPATLRQQHRAVGKQRPRPY